MKQVVELMVLLEVKDMQLTMEEVKAFVTSDTLKLHDCANIELNSPSGGEEGLSDGEQVAVQEEEQQTIPTHEYEDRDQFPAFLLDKLSKTLPNTRKFSRTKKTRMTKRRRQPDNDSHSFFCQHCHMKFSKLKDKEKHALLEHSYELPFICQECGARFKLKEEIKQHMKNHSGGSFQIKCEVCDKVCKAINQYHVHYKNHTGLKEFGCKCGRSFTNFKNLQIHERIHQPKNVSCEHLGKHLKKQQCISKEDDRMDVVVKEFRCSKCEKSFNNLKSLKTHNQVHQPRNVSCDQCGKMFNRKDLLRKHEQIHQPKKFSCDVCGKMFHRKDNMKNHHKKHICND